jgi:DNA helicase-2/ATP-dependent DNA helicase PcrA
VDFGDQVALALKLLRVRPNVRRMVENRYRYILVDEFQDTNYSQFQLVRMTAGQDANLTVEGDDDQSIYKFRGAAISNILNFMDVYPTAEQIVLTENYRSTQVILDTSYRLIQHNNPNRLEVKNRVDKRLVALRPEGDPVEHLHCDTLTTETDRVATTIQGFLDTKRYVPNDFAVLVRSNSDADPYLRSLNMRGIPWRFTGNRGLYSRAEVKLLISFLKVITDPDDSLNLYHFASSEIYELSMEDLHRCLHEAHHSHRPLWRVLNRIDEIEALTDLSDESRMTIRKLVADLRKYLELSRDNVTGVVL